MPDPDNHARGSVLADFLIDGKLLPAEEKLRVVCMRGETCVIGDGKRPEEATDENRVRASFLRYLIMGGCEETPIHQRGLDLEGAFIACRDTPEYGKCLDLEAVIIPQDVVLWKCHIDGSIILLGATAKTLGLDGTRLDQLSADGLETEGDVFIRNGFQATGTVSLLGAKIRGNLECDNSRFEGENTSLVCDGLETNGSVFLSNGFHAEGAVRLPGAKIGRQLDCHSGTINKDLHCNNATIGGNLYLSNNCTIAGTVHLPNARIGGNLNCNDATFTNPDNAILANRMKIDGDVDLGSINAKGTVNLNNAEIGGNVTPQGAVLAGSPSLQLRGAEIAGTLFWRSVAYANSEVDLGGTSCRTINMDGESWMRKRPGYVAEWEGKSNGKKATNNGGNGKPEAEPRDNKDKKSDPGQFVTRLDNFTYKGFSNLPKGCNAKFWIEWLEQQSTDHLTVNFRPRPWEQLAGVLDSMGYEAEARSVRIRKEQLQTNFMAKHEPAAAGFDIRDWLQVLWRRVFTGPIIDYGYRPGKAVLWLAGLILIATGIYWHAAKQGIMAPQIR